MSMDGIQNVRRPPALALIEQATQRLGLHMASDPQTGSLLRTLAASKPGGNLLELGTGTGVATAWILDGMDERSTLLSVDDDETVIAVAQRFLGQDARVQFHVDDMLPQPQWPADHAPKIPRLIAALEARDDLLVTMLHWATGIVIAAKRA